MRIRHAVIALLVAFTASLDPVLASQPCTQKLIANPGGIEAASVRALELDKKIAGLLNEFGMTPGLAVGAVVDDEVVYARGFGYRDLSDCSPVAGDTLFYLLSVTKSFTGMLAALLHAQGQWEIDKSLGEYLPDLTMPDGINPNQISMRDLLVHRPGFWDGAINYRTYGPGNADDDDIRYLLENHSKPYPIKFQYSNMGYVVAATIMKLQTGKDWPVLLEEMIFEPLGMTNTTASIEEAVSGEFALPYRIDGSGNYEAMPVKAQSQMHAAGGAASSVIDLLRWVRVNLAGGQLDGDQVIDARIVRQVHSPQIQYDWRYYKFNRFGYGLGVHNADYDGDLLMHHFGGPIHVSFMPEHDIGVVVLTNGTGPSTAFSHMIATFVYDSLLEKPDTETRFADEILEIREAAQKRVADFEKRDQDLRTSFTPPFDIIDPAPYAGLYLSDRLGMMELDLQDGGLRLRYGALESPLEYVGQNAFLVRLGADENLEIFRFTGEDGSIDTLDWGGRLFERVETR